MNTVLAVIILDEFDFRQGKLSGIHRTLCNDVYISQTYGFFLFFNTIPLLHFPKTFSNTLFTFNTISYSQFLSYLKMSVKEQFVQISTQVMSTDFVVIFLGFLLIQNDLFFPNPSFPWFMLLLHYKNLVSCQMVRIAFLICLSPFF